MAIRLKPMLLLPESEIFLENDQVREMYMLVNGECYFQLSRKMHSFKFIKI